MKLLACILLCLALSLAPAGADGLLDTPPSCRVRPEPVLCTASGALDKSSKTGVMKLRTDST